MLNELDISKNDWYACANNIQRHELKKLKKSFGTENFDLIAASDDVYEVGEANFMSFEAVPYVVELEISKLGLYGYDSPKEVKRIKDLAEKIRETEKISPIIVGLEPNGEFWVVEGQHRSRAFELMGEKTIPAKLLINTELSEYDHEEPKPEKEMDVIDPNQLALFEEVRMEIRHVLNEDAAAWAETVKNELGMKDFDVYERPNGDLKLMMIRVTKDKLHQGIGTKAMEKLISYADLKGSRIILTPALKDSHSGTTSRTRLVNFYKRFGFVENSGRKKDFTISDLMYREPKVKGKMNEGFIEDVTDEVLDKISKSGTKNLNDLEKLILYTISDDKQSASKLSLLNIYRVRNTFGNHEITVMVNDKNSEFYQRTGRLYSYIHYDADNKTIMYCYVDFEGTTKESVLMDSRDLVPISYGDGSDFLRMLKNRKVFKGFGDKDSFFEGYLNELKADAKNYNVKVDDKSVKFFGINGSPVGYIDFHYDGRAISEHVPDDEKEFYIDMVEVYPEHRKMGIAKLILEYAKEHAKKLGATIITLRVDHGMGYGNSERTSEDWLDKLYLNSGFSYMFADEEAKMDDTKDLGAMFCKIG